MSTSDEDEDVVFQGSAIDQHLQSTGYADYESTQIPSCYQEKDCPLEGGKQKVEWAFVRNRILDVAKSLFWPLELRKRFYKRIVRNAYESKLLIPDDLLLLKHFIPQDSLPSNQSGDYFWIIRAIFWCYRGLLLCAFLCFCVALYFLKVSANWSLLLHMLIVTSAIWILSVSWDLYRSTSEVNNFLCVLQDSGHLVSKVLRFLLEEDLISRGFVLAQGSSSFASRGRTEPPYCEGLRLTLHDTLYFMLPVLHHAHSHLKTSISYYPCIRGLFDDFEEINAELRENVTEHLKFLKKLVTLIKLQTSSVITQFILCASDVKAFEDLDKNLFSPCSLNQIEKTSALLLKHFTYAQSFWLKDEERQELSCEENKNNVYLAIHSLSLHLQAALFKIQNLEKKFECLETRSDEDINLEDSLSYESVKEHLSLIQNELNSCQGCLDETSARVDRKYSVKEEEIEKCDLNLGSNIEEDVTAVAGAKKSPIPLFDLEEPIIQDEVFEAYVDQDRDNHDKESDEDFWNTSAREERKKLKQQKQQGKRVINELQPLLNKLRGVWEERETAALLRQKMGHQVQPSVAPVQTKRNSGDTGDLDIAVNEMGSEGSVQKLSDVESRGAKAADCSLKKTSSSSNRPSLECDDYDDSDDERLAMYRKVREELERDEKSHVTSPLADSDDERLEVYRKFRNELDANEKLHQSIKVQERDSDDERLESYRKARKELEIEDKSYSADSEGESNSEKSDFERKVEKRIDGKGKMSLFSKRLKNSASKPKHENSLHSTADGDMVLQNVSERENILDDGMKQSIDILDIRKVLDISKRDNSRNYTDGLKITSEKTNTKSTEFLTAAGNTASNTDLGFANDSDPSKTLEEETFVHGDATDSEDDSPHIDWGTVTLPSRITDTLEDRMQLFCGNSLGFHAGLAAEAVEASQKFLSKKIVETETFLGVGEGEEVFGDDSETE